MNALWTLKRWQQHNGVKIRFVHGIVIFRLMMWNTLLRVQTKYYYANDRLLAEKRTKYTNDLELGDYIYADEIYYNYTDKTDISYMYNANELTGFTLNGVQYFYVRNLFGDITKIYDTNENLVAEYVYDALGSCKILTNIDNIAEINRFRYRGYYQDETGFYYTATRYYDPMTGRFINADSIEMLDQTKDRINGLNLYSYCGNNPIMRTDHTGQDWWSDMWGWVATTAVAIASGVAIVAGTIISATGVGLPLGALLVGAGVGGLIGIGGSIIGQGLTNGWDNINPWQVAFDGLMGGATGAVIASPLGWLATGAIVGGMGFVQSVGGDLIQNNGDWGKVNWGSAIGTGILSGIIAGGAKYLMQSATIMNKFVNKFPGVFKWGHKIGETAYVNFWKALTMGQLAYKTLINGISGGLRSLTRLI